MTPEAVVFDIGNVLIEWQPERFYDREIGADRRRALFAEVDLHGMNELVDRGHPFTGTIYATAEANPEWRAEIRMWHDRWIELATPAIDRSVRMMRALKARGVPVFSLSNFGIESFDLAATHYPFLLEFDRPFVSGRLGVTKPDPRIYGIVEETAGVAPEALMFIDDRADNIAQARARGWQVHHFDGPEGLAERLVAAGLLKVEDAA